MVEVCGLFLAVFYIFIMFVYYQYTKDSLHPAILFLLLEFLRYALGFIFLRQESSVYFTIDGAITVVIYEIVFSIFVLVGIQLFPKILHYNYHASIKNNLDTWDISLKFILLFFIIGFSAKLVVFEILGGISFILANPQLAYQMQAHGFGVFTQLYKFMFIAIIAMYEKVLIHRNNKKYKKLAFLMVALYMLSFLIYTSRTPAFILLLILLFIYHYRVRKLNIKIICNKRFIISACFIVCASFFATSIRTDTTNVVNTSAIIDIITNLSNNGRDMFVYEFFESNEKWYGKGYLNIIPALVPGVIDKPSLDDGIYLVNLMRGMMIDINDSYTQLYYQTGSVPFSSQAYMFANFGLLGLILGGLVLGISYMFFYVKMLNRLDTFNITIYFYVMYSFGLSTGRMVPVLITIVFISIFKRFLIKDYRKDKINAL